MLKPILIIIIALLSAYTLIIQLSESRSKLGSGEITFSEFKKKKQGCFRNGGAKFSNLRGGVIYLDLYKCKDGTIYLTDK